MSRYLAQRTSLKQLATSTSFHPHHVSAFRSRHRNGRLDYNNETQPQYIPRPCRSRPSSIWKPFPIKHNHHATRGLATIASMAEQQPAKKQRTHPSYELLYHPGIPGRGEFVRLAFEVAGVPYTDVANEDKEGGYSTVQKLCMNKETSCDDGTNPPIFSPPALRVPGAGKGGKALVISQTPNILLYLGERLGLVPEDEDGEGVGKYQVNQIALTALDLNNEVHDTHHPIGVMLYYEDQKEESLKKAKDVRENRIPKFLSYFERQLQWNMDVGKGKYLVGGKITYADTTVWQVLDGLCFAFPKEMEARKKEFMDLFQFYDGLKEEKGLKEYLASERRMPYSMGIFRHYPELDRR